MINKIQFTGTLTRIGDTDFWTDGTQHDIDLWDGDREKLREFGHNVMRLTAPRELSERLGCHVNVTTPSESLAFSHNFEE
jgi:hypothetical protein